MVYSGTLSGRSRLLLQLPRVGLIHLLVCLSSSILRLGGVYIYIWFRVGSAESLPGASELVSLGPQQSEAETWFWQPEPEV